MRRRSPDEHLRHFRGLPKPLRVVYGRPRTFIAAFIGVLAGLVLPDTLRPVTRALIAWDVAAILYLAVAYLFVFRQDVSQIRRNAVLQDDGRFLILMVIALGAFASIAAIVAELGARDRGAHGLVLATLTIALSWAMVHTAFALHYAHEYYGESGPEGGLAFPHGQDGDKTPDYWDFVYFAMVVGMTAQVSDVGITDKRIRRTATVHGVVAFVFNTALLALTVNIAASAI